MPMFKSIKESAILTKDILRGFNQTVWGGAEGAEKVSSIVKTGLSGTDAIVGVSHAIEDFACQDHICFTLDCIGSASTTTGIILGNIPATKSLTVVTGSITFTCRAVRYICKRYGLAWSCTIACTGVRTGSLYLVKKSRYIIEKINC